MSNQTKWIRQPQEQKGDYWFSGKFLVTKGIQRLLTAEEIFGIYQEIQRLVEEQQGIDYLVVFLHSETQQKLFFIDQLSKGMIDSGDFLPEYNNCTLMLSSEY